MADLSYGNAFGGFDRLQLLMDVNTTFGAKASKYKNPINEMGVTTVWTIRKSWRKGLE